MFEMWFCKHSSMRIEDKQLVCNQCNYHSPLPKELTEPSGVFQRIADRIEQEKEYSRLVKLGDEYLADRRFNRSIEEK